MKKRKPPRMTNAEAAYVADMERDSALEKLERGEARILSPSEYPEPLKRLIARERLMLHIKLSLASKRKLEALSRARGVSSEKLARQWLEKGLQREAG